MLIWFWLARTGTNPEGSGTPPKASAAAPVPRTTASAPVPKAAAVR